MAAIPKSTLPGHKQVHEKVVTTLELCHESKSIEFKESASWNNLKIKILKTTLAMSNLNYGGLIIIGVSERNDTWSLDGIDDQLLGTFNEDDINDYINKYASPPLLVRLVTVEYSKKVFLVIEVNEFDETPIVCKRNGPDGSKLKRGDILIRPSGKPRTERIKSAEDIHDLLALSSEKHARKIIAISKRIGMTVPKSSVKIFDEELGDL